MRRLAWLFAGILSGCASTDGRDMPACLSEERPVPELRACIDSELAPLRSELARAYWRAEAKYKDDRAMLFELEITAKVKDLNDHVDCVVNAELAALRKAQATGSYSKLESARLFFACQRRQLMQRAERLDWL